MTDYELCEKDPHYFITNYMKLPNGGDFLFEKEHLEILDELESIEKLIYKNTRRQNGKTTLAAAYMLWASIFKKSYTDYIIMSPNHNNSKNILDAFRYMNEHLDSSIKLKFKKNSSTYVELSSGISLMLGNQNSLLGRKVDFAYLDEGDYIPNIEVVLDKLFLHANVKQTLLLTTGKENDYKTRLCLNGS